MCRSANRVSRSPLREVGQTRPEYSTVLAGPAGSTAFLFADLGANVPAMANAVAGLLP